VAVIAVEAAVREAGLQLLDRRPHLLFFNNRRVPATYALASSKLLAFDELTARAWPLLGGSSREPRSSVALSSPILASRILPVSRVRAPEVRRRSLSIVS